MQITKNNVDVLLETEVSSEIISEVIKNSAALSMFRQLPTVSTDKVRIRVLDSLPDAYWVNEKKNNGRKRLTKMAWDNVYLNIEELAVIVPIKENLLNDLADGSGINVWGELRPRIVEAMYKKIDQAIFTGVDKPESWRADLLTSVTSIGATVTETASLYKDISNAMGYVEESDYVPNGLIGGLSLKAKFRNEFLDSTGQPLQSSDVTELRRNYISNGSWDKEKATMIVGDFSQAVFAFRQDFTVKVLTEGVIQDPDSGEILFNLGQDDMVALRCVVRLGWALPQSVSMEKEASVRFPFAAVVPSGADTTTYNVTFTVQDSDMSPVKGAKVSLGGLSKKTDGSGNAVIKATANDYVYRVKAEGYDEILGAVSVSKAESVTVTLPN